MAQKKGSLPKNIVFTSGDPTVASKSLPPNVPIAIKIGGGDGATDEQIQQVIASGRPVVFWQSEANQEGIDAVNKYHPAGYIAQAEGPGQLEAAQSIVAQMSVPHGFVTNYVDANYVPKDGTVMFELYLNKNVPASGATPEILQQLYEKAKGIIAQFKAMGVTDINLTLGNYDAGSEGGGQLTMAQYLEIVKRLQAENPDIKIEVSSYIFSTWTPEDQQAYLDYVAGNTPPPAAAPEPPSVTAATSTQTSQTQDKPKEPPALGIDGPHQEAGSFGAPEPYAHGAEVVDDPSNPNDTFSFTGSEGKNKGKRITITTTASGAMVEQVEGHTPYQIKAPESKPFDASRPAWHQDPRWGSPNKDLAKTAGLESDKVLEQRPGANGKTIFRMADGTYKTFDPTTGQVTGAGTWNANEWEPSQHGQVNVNPIPAGTDPAIAAAIRAHQSTPAGGSSITSNLSFGGGPTTSGSPTPPTPPAPPPPNPMEGLSPADRHHYGGHTEVW